MTQKPTETETQAKDADKPKQNTKPLDSPQNPKQAELDKRSLRKSDFRKAFARPGFNL